ncbi:unnamed protein product [Rhodiola kirilowii]
MTNNALFLFITHAFIFTLCFPLLHRASASPPACPIACGTLSLKYPIGGAPGCGSPRFVPYITCSSNHQLLLKTHTGLYPITSISYSTYTLTISPPLMSTCNSMKPSPNLGLDWAGPFHLGPSTFILLACNPQPSSLICDASYSHLCASLYTCPSVASFGFQPFGSSNSCCVYGPANLDSKGELDVCGLGCRGYASVVGLGEYPLDPWRWEYGVALKFDRGAMENSDFATACDSCQRSGGVCGYAPPADGFVCVCENRLNTTTDCYDKLGMVWSSSNRVATLFWLAIALGSTLWCGLYFNLRAPFEAN